MHLLAGITLVLVTVAFVHSKPIISEMNNFNAAVPRTDFLALANELQLNNLDAVLATFPQFAVISN
jgi:hypothetical protein